MVSQLLGQGTNNIAEYRAGIEGLKAARERGATEVELRMDSKLVVEQIHGHNKVKNAASKLLHAEVLELLKACAAAHIPREENQRADELANLAYEVPTA